MSASFYQPSKISFSNPFNGRKWLNLLVPSIEYGLKFKPSISFKSRRELGFTFQTNELGFHGNSVSDADNVILGTSFGMGLGVDEGDNWFQLDDQFKRNYFNIAMPVSPHNHLNALKSYYRGKGKVLLYIYHPNVWKTAASFYKSEKHNKNIFEFLNWSVDNISILKLLPKWFAKKFYFTIFGIDQRYKDQEGNAYWVNTKYNYFPLNSKENQELFLKAAHGLNQIFEQFDKVYLFRIPIKEQLINKEIDNKHLKALCANYDECWDAFMNVLPADCTNDLLITDFANMDFFQLKDFLPKDTHWSPKGNQKFYSYLIDKVEGI